MRWSFPSNNKGDINGIGNSGVETFQGTPMKSLAREICQNSLDAALEGKTVEIEFMPFVLDIGEFPDAESLEKAFSASLDFWSVQSVKKATDFFERAIKMVESGSIPFLRISDFNTSGLKGSKSEYNTPWCNLTKSSGASDKSGTSGGSFGIGKFAPFACSEFRTVFYSTLDIDNVAASQGISRITSFRREDDEITVGVGYYGADNNQPVYSQLNLDPNFIRGDKRTGTDIFIAGFRFYSTDWKDSIITSVLDGFLYAIYTGKLVVKVADILINKDTLSVMITEYQTSLTENADKYYTVLTSDDTTWYEVDFKNHGTVRLGLIIQSDRHQIEMHRKVAMIRKTGMKIMDRSNISGIIPFAGIMLIEGNKINDFLRNLENPQHTKWEPERMEPKSQVPYARAYIKDLIDYIKDCLDKLKKDGSVDEIDPNVGEYLPDESDLEFGYDNHEIESLPDTIKAIEVTVPPHINYASNLYPSGDEYTVDDEQGDIVEEDNDSGAGHNEGNDSRCGFGSGFSGGDGRGENPREQKKSLISIVASKKRIVCLNKYTGEYSITFVPTCSAENGCIDLFLSAESHKYDAPIISAIGMGQPPLMVNGNRISGLSFTKKRAIRLKVSIDYSDYCSMEVKAYGNKI
ncbi:MAG: hypothetical protein PHP79_03485 [Clostridia bacterium]|nr:hypothetical protein [Clostridia bacterium]